MTRDSIEIERLNATMNYKIFDARRFVREAEESAENFASAIGHSQLVSYAGARSLSQLRYESDQNALVNQLNIAPPPRSPPYGELERLGIEMTGLYLEDINLPNQYRTSLVKQAEAESEAAGQIKLAWAEVESIRITGEILNKMGIEEGKLFEAYKQLKALDIKENFSKSEGGKTIVLGLENVVKDVLGN